MLSGKLNKRLEILPPVETRANNGQTIITYPSIEATRWASVVPLNSREVSHYSGLFPEVSHKITLRYYAGLTSKHHLRLGNRVFNMVAPPIDVAEKKEYHECLCVQISVSSGSIYEETITGGVALG